MVRITKVYTKTGDGGSTGLADGSRVAKTHARIEALGAVDEANATLGVARLHAKAELDAILGRIQNELFDLGADLATPLSDKPALRVVAAQVSRLEGEIDALNAQRAALTSFILPGGTPAAAFLHQARAVCRRAERRLAALIAAEGGHEEALRYLNRLSDLLFVAARAANPEGDVLWAPGATR